MTETWHTPRTFSVEQMMTAGYMNEIRDNLGYLMNGRQRGQVALDATYSTTSTTFAAVNPDNLRLDIIPRGTRGLALAVCGLKSVNTSGNRAEVRIAIYKYSISTYEFSPVAQVPANVWSNTVIPFFVENIAAGTSVAVLLQARTVVAGYAAEVVYPRLFFLEG